MKQKCIVAGGLRLLDPHCSFVHKVVNLAGVKSLMRQLVLHPEGNWEAFLQRKRMERGKKNKNKNSSISSAA